MKESKLQNNIKMIPQCKCGPVFQIAKTDDKNVAQTIALTVAGK